MSVSTRLDRTRALMSPDALAAGEPERQWVGVDFSGGRARGRSLALVPLLVLALIVALGVAALRIDLIRTRYAVAAALEEEQALLEEQRALIVRKRQLRDPVELAVQARARGFRPPARVYSLTDPTASSPADAPSALPLSALPPSALPDVAAAPSGGRAR